MDSLVTAEWLANEMAASDIRIVDGAACNFRFGKVGNRLQRVAQLVDFLFGFELHHQLFESRIGCGFRWRRATLRFSTITRPCFEQPEAPSCCTTFSNKTGGMAR